MRETKPTYMELEARCLAAESALDAIRSGQTDTVLGAEGVLVLRLQETEDALRASEARYRSTLDTMLEGCQIIDFAWRYVYLNDAAVRQSRFARAELLGHTMMEMYPGIDETPMFAVLQDCMENRAPRRIENEFVYTDGSKGWFDLRIAPMPEGLYILSEDITAHKLAEASLRESQERFRTVAEFTYDWEYWLDEKRQLQYISPSCERVTGYPTAWFLQDAENLRAVVHPADRALFEAHFKNEFENTAPGQMDFRIVTADGQTRWLSHTCQQVRGENGALRGRRVSNRDITESKAAEAQIRESELNYRRLLNGMNDSVWVIDFDTRILDVNAAAVQMLGYTREELLVMTVPEIDVNLKPEAIRTLAAHMPDDKFQIFETAHRAKDGRDVPVEVNSSLVTYAGRPVILSIARDISERKRAEDALRISEARANAMLNAIPDMMFRLSREGVFLDYRAEVQDLYDRSDPTLIGLRNRDIAPAEFADLIDDKIRLTLESGTLQTFEYGLEIPGGGVQQYEARMAPGGDDDVVAIVRNVTERKRAEQELRTSQEQYRLLFEAATDAVLLHVLSLDRAANRFRRFNENACRMLGYTAEEFALLGPLDIQPPEELERVPAEAERMALDRELRFEKTFLRKDGTALPVEIHSSVFELDGEQLVLSLVRDITERKQAEEKLRESEAQYRLLAENITDVIWILDMEQGRFRYVSPSVTRLRGYTVEQVLSVDAAQSLTAASQTYLAQVMPARLAEFAQGIVKVYVDQVAQPCLDGSTVWTETTTRYMQNPTTGRLEVYGVSRDITERKRVEDELHRAEQRYRPLIENATDGIVLVSQDGKFKYISPSVERLMGYRFEEIAPFDPADLTHPDDREMVIGKLADLMREPSYVPTLEYRFLHRNGTWRWVESTFSNLLNLPGVEAIIINFRDIQERKYAEQEVRKRNEDLQLVNALNDAVNRGQSLSQVFQSFQARVRELFACQNVAVYLVSADGQSIELEQTTIPGSLLQGIESLIGQPIPRVRVPLSPGSVFQRLLAQPEGILTSDPALLRQVLLAMTDSEHLSLAARSIIRNLVPDIQDLLDFKSAIFMPLYSSERAIGLLDMSSRDDFSAEDLERVRGICMQMTAVILRKQAEEQALVHLNRITVLSEIDRAISSSFDMHLSLDIMLTEGIKQLGVDAACILLLNPVTFEMNYFAGRGFRTMAAQTAKQSLRSGLSGQVGRERKTVHLPNPANASLHTGYTELAQKEGFVEYVGVPLLSKGVLKGVFEVFHRSRLRVEPEWLNFLETLGRQTAIAIDNAQSFEALQTSNLELMASYDATIAGWSQAMDLRDQDTEGHTRRVTELTLRLAEQMGFDDKALVHLRRGALLHDIGKIGVPDAILHKPGPLTDAEWEIMKRHPTYAYEMLSGILYLRPALEIPWCHHEWWDGSGYPRGLKENEIPLAARLFAVVDVYDALTSDRPYRRARTKAAALDHIREYTGTHFDPEVVRAFLRLAKA